MNMFSNPEDDEFFNPTSTSNLASLFGTFVAPRQDTDASLIYTAPKQPKAGGQETPKTTQKSTPQSAVICSKFVDVFKLSDKNHTSQGKCGLAIIGNQSVKTYEVIIYKSKQEIMTRSKLNSDFTFTVQSNNFSYFCDDRKQEWSVHFENAKELEDFVEKMKIYNGKIVYNHRNIEELQNKNPKPEENILKLSTSSTGKDRDSDSTSDNSINKTRANILTRMAKVGQSILPVTVPSKSSEHSDSETDEQIINRKLVKKRQKVISFNGDYNPSEKTNLVSNQTLSMQTAPVPEYVMVNGQLVLTSSIQKNLPTPYVNTLQGQYVHNIPNQIMMSQPQVSPMSDSLHIFIAENRTHNCEMRMNISQLSTKLDQVLSNINKNGQASASETPAINEVEFLEKVKELEESKKIISNLKEQHTKFQEISADNKETMNNLSQQNQELNKVILEQQNTIQQLQKEKSILEEQNTHNNISQQNLEEAQKTIIDLRQVIDNQQSNISKLEKLQEENKEQNSETCISQLNESIASLKSQLSNKSIKADLFSKKLKQSMNSLYQQIMENFEDETVAFHSTQIKQIVSQKLKSATLTIIQEFQNDFEDHESTQSSQVAPLVPQFD